MMRVSRNSRPRATPDIRIAKLSQSQRRIQSDESIAERCARERKEAVQAHYLIKKAALAYECWKQPACVIKISVLNLLFSRVNF